MIVSIIPQVAQREYGQVRRSFSSQMSLEISMLSSFAWCSSLGAGRGGEPPGVRPLLRHAGEAKCNSWHLKHQTFGVGKSVDLETNTSEIKPWCVKLQLNAVNIFCFERLADVQGTCIQQCCGSFGYNLQHFATRQGRLVRMWMM